MKLLNQMSAADFKQKVGRLPVDDDLDRVNCEHAGEIGHEFCGWNSRKCCPMFQNQYEEQAYLVTSNGYTGYIYTNKTLAMRSAASFEEAYKTPHWVQDY